MEFLLLNLPIGLDFMEILWHLLNFAILLIGIRFLLYKPIKKFISKREEEYKDIEESNNNLQKQAQEMKDKYEALLVEEKSQVAKIAKETADSMNENVKKIIKSAREEAKLIIEKAQSEIKDEKDKILPTLKQDSSELAILIAKKILNREITVSDMDNLIDECLDNWGNQ